jgi:hypothetical protein
MTTHDEMDDAVDLALRARLAKLAAVPVDTSRLEKAIKAQLPPQASPWRRRLMPLAALAASFLLIVTVSLALLQSREAQASPAMMAQMHRDIVSGAIPTMHADSIDDANKAIAAFAGNFPTLPQPPGTHTMACCMRNIGDKRVACVLLNNAGTPVTMAVADASEVDSPNSPTAVRNGITYHIQTVGDLHMVMSEREHRWICLIGALPEDKLMDLADAIHF